MHISWSSYAVYMNMWYLFCNCTGSGIGRIKTFEFWQGRRWKLLEPATSNLVLYSPWNITVSPYHRVFLLKRLSSQVQHFRGSFCKWLEVFRIGTAEVFRIGTVGVFRIGTVGHRSFREFMVKRIKVGFFFRPSNPVWCVPQISILAVTLGWIPGWKISRLLHNFYRHLQLGLAIHLKQPIDRESPIVKWHIVTIMFHHRHQWKISWFKFMSVKGQESVLDAIFLIRENRTNVVVRKSNLRGPQIGITLRLLRCL